MTSYPARRDDASAPFFDAINQGRLIIKRCGCGRLNAPDRWDCAKCPEPVFKWVESSGNATLVSWIVDHIRVPNGPDETKMIGLVELAEGPWMYAELVGDAAQLRGGMGLTLDVVRPEVGEPIPGFRLG